MNYLESILRQKRQPLEIEAYEFLEDHGVDLLPYFCATSKQEISEFSSKTQIGEFVCKVMSPKILHKSDFQAVKLGVEKEELIPTFVQLSEKFERLDFRGVLVVPMAPPGVEFLIGSTTDPTFGVITIFGVGGTLVEIISDVTFGKAPVSLSDARLMIDEIESQELLDGPRGLPSTDRIEMAELLVKISKLSIDYKEFIREIDLNPVRVTPNGIFPLDARIIFHPEKC